VLLLVGLLSLLSACVTKNSTGVPCELLMCTDFSSEEDAWDNGVIREICGMDCIVAYCPVPKGVA
jgi:hypothetical protein